MRRTLLLAACCVSMACSSSTTNEAPATGGSGGATGGSGGATGGSGGATGGSGGGPTCKYVAASAGFDCTPHKPTQMAVDSTAIYWALNDGSGTEHLFRVLKTDKPTSVGPWAKIGNVSSVGDIVVDQGHVYVGTTSTSRQLIRYAIPSGAEQVLVSASDCTQPYARAPLAIDSAGVYFACNGSTDFIGIWKKADNASAKLFDYPVSVTVDGLASNGSTLVLAIDDLDNIPLPSGTAGLITAGAGYTRVAMVGNVIYAQNASAVRTHNTGGGSVGDAMTGVAGIVDFRVDGTGIYAILSDKIVGKKLDALGNTEIAKTITPGGIALDATHVYFTNTAGSVHRAERAVVTP